MQRAAEKGLFVRLGNFNRKTRASRNGAAEHVEGNRPAWQARFMEVGADVLVRDKTRSPKKAPG